MNHIQKLDDILISKISAGEVIERPASVLKEFLENSVDAGAKRISVELDSGGKRLVRVADDGCGMSREDAVLSVERHTTSKIKNEKELASVSTFGFRGEALASIAAVSRFSLETRPRDCDTGTLIVVEGGRSGGVKDTGCPAGTTVEARSLFFNTRPRLKFLKTNETELSRCAGVIRSIALANPEVGFEVLHNGKSIFSFSPGDLERRVGDVLGKIKPYEIEATGGAVEIKGFLCSPLDGFSSMTHFYCYVNGRYVRDRFVNKVVIGAFGRTFERGRYPQGALFINLSSEEVDVNVHPTKHEVRFKSPAAVAASVRAAVEAFLSSAPWITGYPEPSAPRQTSPMRETPESERYGSGSRAARQSIGAQVYGKPPVNKAPDLDFTALEEPPRTGNPQGISSPAERGFFSQLNRIGLVAGLYIICESKEGLVLIDQHAAHERVNFERLKNSYLNDGGLKAQRLLIPEIIEMRPEDIILFAEIEPKMSRIGFGAEAFGEDAIRLGALPAILPCVSGRNLFIDIFTELKEADCPELSNKLDEKTEHILATMACHRSIRAGYITAEEELNTFFSDMDKCESPHFCPHGRPVAVRITYGSLEKMFKRK